MRTATETSNLAVLFPALAAEWHPTKNGERRPEHFLPMSNKPAWWQCSKNSSHEWPANINSRHRAGCPLCHAERDHNFFIEIDGIRRKRTLLDEPGLLAEVATEAERTAISKLYVGSVKKVSWKCGVCEQVWTNQIRKRYAEGQNCPYCSNQKTFLGNSLQLTHPLLAAEWDYERNTSPKIAGGPSTVNAGTHHVAWWRCVRHPSWPTEIRQRVSQNTGCPKCNPQVSRLELRLLCELRAVLAMSVERGTKIAGFEADLQISDMAIVIEVDGYPWHSPHMVPSAPKRDLHKNSVFAAAGKSVIRIRERRLPAIDDCKTVRFDDGVGHLTICQALLEAIADFPNLSPSMVQRISDYCHAEAFADDAGYAKLAAAVLMPEIGGSLAETHPEIAAQWHADRNAQLSPEHVTAGTKQRAWWTCSVCQHNWQASVNSRTKHGCPRCSGRVVTPGRTLSDVYPDVAAQWDIEANTVSPNTVTPTSSRSFSWRCEVGHTWMSSVQNRTRNGQGCPYCAHK